MQSEGGLKERSIRQLSGGERRRVALALALGFADLTAGRGQLRCNLIVLDEVQFVGDLQLFMSLFCITLNGKVLPCCCWHSGVLVENEPALCSALCFMKCL